MMSSLGCLNIRQEYSKIDLNINDAKLDLKNASAPAKMDANTQAAVLEITREKGGFEITSYPCRYARGFKNIMDFTRDNAQEGMKAIQEFTASIVDKGTQMTLGVGKNIVGQVAYSNFMKDKSTWAISLEYVPKPDINYIEDDLNISYTMGSTNLSVEQSKVENNTQQGSIEVLLTQRESIRMWVTQGKYDIYA
jgi:hypothetical protein